MKTVKLFIFTFFATALSLLYAQSDTSKFVMKNKWYVGGGVGFNYYSEKISYYNQQRIIPLFLVTNTQIVLFPEILCKLKSNMFLAFSIHYGLENRPSHIVGGTDVGGYFYENEFQYGPRVYGLRHSIRPSIGHNIIINPFKWKKCGFFIENSIAGGTYFTTKRYNISLSKNENHDTFYFDISYKFSLGIIANFNDKVMVKLTAQPFNATYTTFNSKEDTTSTQLDWNQLVISFTPNIFNTAQLSFYYSLN